MTTTATQSVLSVAQGLVELCRKGEFVKAVETYYAPNIVSVQAAACGEGPRIEEGYENVLANNKKWLENSEVHSMQVSEPFVSETGFSVIFTMDFTCKQTNQRITGPEIAVYDVENGKIVRESFYCDAKFFQS